GSAIVVGSDQRIACCLWRHAWAVGQAHRRYAGARLYQQHIGMTVITAAKFDELIATGICSCQAQGTHGSLGARVDEAHHFKRWYAIDHQSCQIILGLGGCVTSNATLS